MSRREAERFLSALAEVRAAGARAASAVVVRVHGSAYRREGARMLVRSDGTYVCSLSGGCLEPAVADAAARVITTGVPATVTYDLADDSIWSLNIGCSGAVDIRIERIDDDPVTTAWLGVLERGDAAVLVTRLSGGEGRRVVYPSGPSVGTLGDAALDAAADRAAHERVALPSPTSGADVRDGVEIFVEVNQPPPELVIFGAGQDAVPLVRQAWMLGFEVTVVDPRASYLQSHLFAGARLLLTGYDELDSTLTLPRGAYVVVMSHHMERDRLALSFVFERDPAYIGVLGPRARYERLLASLASEGFEPTAALLQRVHSPVGLALGAEAPEEVALSILAEILAVRRGFAGGFLAGETGSLHRLADPRAVAGHG
jgi:xanthine/CO dehydrogenase XdhC/CoxF family maturation factor